VSEYLQITWITMLHEIEAFRISNE